MRYLQILQQYRQWNINTFVRSADFIFKTIWAIAFLERMWYGKETTIICVKTIYLLYFEYIICHLFSYLISWTNISSNTILFIIINSVMVICRGAACIFFWVPFVDKYICFLFFAMSKSICKNSWLSSNITFCAFLINSLFVIFQKSVYFKECVLYKSATVQICSLLNLTDRFDVWYNIFGK